MRRRSAGSWSLCAGLVLIALTGCQPPVGARIELTTFDDVGELENHYADFPQAWYRRLDNGTVELAMQSDRPSTIDPTQTITQIVYIKGFWNPRPGTTYVEASQINARVQYAMLTPPTGVRYDGGAFITYKNDRHSGDLIGKIESGDLSPRYRMGNAVEPFGPATFTGRYRAIENPGQVVKLAQVLNSQFSATREK